MADQITQSFYMSVPVGADTVNFATPAFEIANLHVLLDGPDVRGGDRLLPTTAGVKAYKRRATVTRRFLELNIYGAKTRTGAATSSLIQGLIDNIALVRTVTDPYSTGDGTRTATLHFPDTTTKTAAVHFISPLTMKWEADSLVRAVMIVELPTGSFT